MPRAAMFRSLITTYGFWWTLALATTLLLLIALAIFEDFRWAIIALMLICLIIPMMAALFYIIYGTSPETALNLALHKAQFSPKEITITILQPSDDEKTDVVKVRDIGYKKEAIGHYETIAGGIKIPMRGPSSHGFLYVPYSSFKSEEDFKEVISWLSEGDH